MQARITVTDLFERWAAVELIRRKDGGKEIRRMFRKDVLPALGPLAVEDVRKGHITAVTDALLARGVTRMAKMIFSLIRQMFRYAVNRDIIEIEPTAAIRKARIGGKPTERDRVLNEDEIRALHRQIPSARLFPTTEAALWLALATGCRIGELLRAEWQHVRLAAREWFIPADNSKNDKPHTIYLSDFALRHFAALQAINGGSKWCFPNRDDSEHVCVKTVTKQLGDRQRGDATPMSHRSPQTNALALPGGKWTPHDLRRTGATLMTALGVLPEVAEKCLNHTEESRVKRTYQRYSYDTEKREAWRLLGERLDLLTRSDDNVVTLKRRNKSAEPLTA
ncbi:MAG: site-specific integrase [Sulfuritalea sp.]|nr:site-specific integrase [Sulfuritalea sp.]